MRIASWVDFFLFCSEFWFRFFGPGGGLLGVRFKLWRLSRHDVLMSFLMVTGQRIGVWRSWTMGIWSDTMGIFISCTTVWFLMPIYALWIRLALQLVLSATYGYSLPRQFSLQVFSSQMGFSMICHYKPSSYIQLLGYPPFFRKSPGRAELPWNNAACCCHKHRPRWRKPCHSAIETWDL